MENRRNHTKNPKYTCFQYKNIPFYSFPSSSSSSSSSFLSSPWFALSKTRPNEMFVSSPFLYSNFFLNCKLDLNHFNIYNSTFVISTLAHHLLIVCPLCPILTNYNFTLVSIKNSELNQFMISQFHPGQQLPKVLQ